MNVVTRRYHTAHCLTLYGGDTVSGFAVADAVAAAVAAAATRPISNTNITTTNTVTVIITTTIYLLTPHFYPTEGEIHLNK
jgi:F0F1-type ATP synthase membrane subunit c/vacuolar-type H+-ATPase subunit K